MYLFKGVFLYSFSLSTLILHLNEISRCATGTLVLYGTCINGLSTNFGDKKKSGVTDFTVVNGCTVTQPEKKSFVD